MARFKKVVSMLLAFSTVVAILSPKALAESELEARAGAIVVDGPENSGYVVNLVMSEGNTDLAEDEDKSANQPVALADLTSSPPLKENATFNITSAGELLWVAEQASGGYTFKNETVQLMNDIDLEGASWTGIGYNLNNYFAGTFNGNNHVISNFKAEGSVNSFTILNAPRHTTGLFGVCSEAKIKNLIIENVTLDLKNDSGYQNSYSSIDGTSVFGGIVCGYAVNSTFQNIIVRSSSVAISTGAEAAYAHAGGFVGYAEKCNFAHCGNEGTRVLANSDSLNNDAYAGGIVGKLVNEAVVRQCYNTGEVSGKSSIATAYVGGIIGYSSNTSSTLSTIRDCYNKGGLSCTAAMMSDGVAGGIIGYSYSTVNRCYSSGSITATKSYIGSMTLGGIAGSGSSASSVSNSAVMSTSISGGTSSSIISNTGTKENNIAVNGLSGTNDADSRYAVSEFYGSALYKSALSWAFPQIWVDDPKGFPTLKYVDADQEEDILVVDEAAATVEILFADGDSYDKVTQNVTLKGDSSKASIVWRSSNETVLSSTGEVNRNEDTYRIRLTATISSGEYSVQKRFVLDVLGKNEIVQKETAEWAMDPDHARQFVATMRGCKIKDIAWNDSDVRVLTGQELNEDAIAETLANVFAFWEVPGESQFLKKQMGDVIGLIKSGSDFALKDAAKDFSDGWVSINSDDEPEVKATAVAKNLVGIADKMYGVQINIVSGYTSIKGLHDYKLSDYPFISALDIGKKVGNFINAVTPGKKPGNVVNNCVQILAIFEGLNALKIEKQNHIKAYLKMYSDNRPAFDSAEDPMFQLIMDAYVVSSILTEAEVAELETVAEQLYFLNEKFGGGLADEYKITICCPVDVAVYDTSGKLVGRVVNNVVDRSIPNSLYITVGGENNDEKTIYFQDRNQYSISLVGNDTGVMSVQMERQDSTDATTYTYSDIALNSGKSMILDVTAGSFTMEDGQTPRIVVVENGLETDEAEEIDLVLAQYPLTVYPCLVQPDGTIALSTSGGYCESDYAVPGTPLASLVHVNSGYLLVGLYSDTECQEAFLETEMPERSTVLYAKFKANETGITIVTQPQGASYYLHDAAQMLQVITDNNSNYNFQWYCYIDDKKDAVPLEGAVESTFLPDVSTEGTKFYFARVFLHSGNETTYLDSDAAKIVVERKPEYASGSCGNGIAWTLMTDGTLSITGNGAMSNYTSGTAPWYNYRDKIERIQVSDGLTYVGSYAFAGCSRLQEVDIPNSVESIGTAVLQNCSSLRKMTIPFVGASRTVSQREDAVLGHWFGIVQTGVTQYYLLSGSSLSGYQYGIPASLQEVTITDASQIPFGAFYNCSRLTSITLNEGIENIAQYSFRSCSGLTEITVPDSVQTVQEGAFYNCPAIEKISIPFVGTNRTASGYEGVLGVIFSRSMQGDTQKVTQYHALNGSSLSGYGYNIPATLKEVCVTDANRIPFGAFSNLTTVNKLSLNGEVATISDCAFYQCSGLTDVYYERYRADWDAIVVGSNNEQLSIATIHCLEDVPAIPVASIMLNKSAITLKVDDTETLVATVNPPDATNKTVIWSSSNIDVATVSNGSVTAQAGGTATITVTAEDGGFQADCVVIVVDDTVHNHNFSTDWTGSETHHWHTCSGCAEISDKAEHQWDAGTQTTAPTCTVAGIKTFTCSVCQQAKTEPIPAAGHSFSGIWSKDNANHWHICENCSETSGTAAHAFDNGITTTQPTYDEEGEKTYTCQTCQWTKTEPTAKLDHHYSDAWSKNSDKHWHACIDSGYENLTADEAPHIWDTGLVTTEPTAETAGEKIYTCTICGQTRVEALTALSGYAIQILKNTSASTKLSLTNQTKSETSVQFIVAAYDQHGKMVAIKMVDEILAASGSLELTVSYTANSNVRTIKAFVLSSSTSAPLRGAWSRQVSG